MEKAWCIVFKIPALVQALSVARVGPVLMTRAGLLVGLLAVRLTVVSNLTLCCWVG